ncbi:TPA: ABC transporter ATP-binding protein [Pseudomonas aeruginosa]|uniref:ABC transporter ATP-binding protein n=1 Tax=Pseudomonas aeruginosa TaxID=287 RepID=UPI0009365BF8|nr:ABC transporter ATP-binding protein [Pseudomonas aeruginosa]MBI8982107.1 ABC transporter ATP-binding protein [Pseudomonas aeruginosa]MCS7816565.1 ABC transporter ATP-binding protein [Pseudomonas aeruginosa]MCS7852925.1 ABC transporter ATP-binding protein [Pseudomonas aeruginosa]MCS8253186.1 ABC transporter ATP-binding protein [Pseudomonas aeruginosa]MCS8259603.1 ABC transporter ATP-binding protein [Pseudomonas aeruginosa]
MIEFKNVSKTYGHGADAAKVLDDVSLHIGRGELVVLIGASGSGKSTLLKMINCMEQPDTGTLALDGQDIARTPVRELRLRMGYVIQSVGLFPHWTVARNIGVVPTMLNWSPARIAARVTELLTLFDLDPVTYGPRYPHQLSGGQQQRVGVARALAGDPDVLLMDEPFGALDPLIRAALQDELKRIHQTSGKTIIMVTHDIDEALRLGTQVVLLEQGRIVQVGSPLALLSQPANDQVADFVGRSDVGIKLLSLQKASSLARLGAPENGPNLLISASLREAVSILALHRCNTLNLLDDTGAHAGVLHAADLFNRTPIDARHGNDDQANHG